MKIMMIRYKRTRGVMEGGEMAAQQHYEALKNLYGAENVDTYYIHDEGNKHTIFDYLVGLILMPFGYYFGLTKSKQKEIASKSHEYDVVLIDRSVFGRIAKELKKTGYKGRIVTFFHNVEPEYFATKLKGKPWLPIVKRCVEKNDRYAVSYSDQTVTLNRRDESEIDKLYKLKNNAIIPITLTDNMGDSEPDDTVMTSSSLNLLFIGAYFKANNDGIKWWIENVMPNVNVHLTIAGKNMDKLKPELSLYENVEIKSNVPDLKPLIMDADAVALPIYSGSGMKVKTCDSLMYGKNILGTDEAFCGYEVDYKGVGALCNTKEEWIDAIKEMGMHSRSKFNKYSRAIFLSKYSTKSVERTWKNVVEG